MIKEILSLSYKELRSLLISRELSAIDVCHTFLDMAKNNKLNAFREITEENAVKQAEISQKRIDKKEARFLECMPIGIKDNYCTKGILTTACSKMLKDFVPPYESTVTEALFNSGAFMIGKCNMDEFGMGSSNTNSYFGNVINPYRSSENDEDLVAGGSSGGSACAVASHACLTALGTDTGGSVRLPAAFTGLVGIKPTYGRCSRYGIIAFASSFDQAGVFGKTVEDAALVLQSMSGFDPRDSTSRNLKVPDMLSKINSSVKGKKIGIAREFDFSNTSTCVINSFNKAKKCLEEEGVELVEISIPNLLYSLATYYIITSVEMASNLARYDGIRYTESVSGDSFKEILQKTRSQCFGDEVKRRIIAGSYAVSSEHFSSYYEKALKVRRLIYNDFLKCFEKVDAILSPVSDTTAFPISKAKDSMVMYDTDKFTVPASIAGVPAVSVPFGLSKDKLPIGVQVIGKHYDEPDMLNFANILEKYRNL